ncbi:hypothetical protein C4565_04120 [Candidatus Parcubacteria bacterium]|jgi:uncharacterized Tic20 family protein|nr:MAG: hypothetical protein C4565_04120 [Candidatus Parcubacteria bacterium]
MNRVSKFAIIGFSLLTPALAMAQATGVDVSTVGGLVGKVNTFVKLAVAVLFVLATIFIVMAAFKYLTGKGDPNEIKKAQAMIVWAIVAMVVALFAWAIPKIVTNFLGVSVSNIESSSF